MESAIKVSSSSDSRICCICQCVLSEDNRSERASNVCREYMHSLEF